MSDAQHYRTKAEVEEYRKIDPITQVKDLILRKNTLLKQIAERSEIKNKVAECEKFARKHSPVQQMYDMVYEQEDYPFYKHKL